MVSLGSWVLGTILTLILFKNPQALSSLLHGFGQIVQDQARRMRKDDDDDPKKLT